MEGHFYKLYESHIKYQHSFLALVNSPMYVVYEFSFSLKNYNDKRYKPCFTVALR